MARRASSVHSARRCSSSTCSAASAAASRGDGPVRQRSLGGARHARAPGPRPAARSGLTAWGDDRGRARGREVAVRARVLREAGAGPARLLRHLDLDEQLVRRARGVERAEEELRRLDRAGAAVRSAGGSARRARSAPPAARRPDRRARPSRPRCRGCGSAGARQPHRLVQQRPAARGPSSERSSAAWRVIAPIRSGAVVRADVVELGEAVDVDEQLGPREPQVQHRHEALAAGEHRRGLARAAGAPRRATRARA